MMLVKDIKVGDKVDSRFAVISANLGTYSKGFRLNLELGDRSGTVNAIFWECDPEIRNNFKPGDIVNINAHANIYQNEIQLNLNSIELAKGENDITQFIPSSVHSSDQMWAKLLEKIDSVENEHIKSLLKYFVEDENFIRGFKLSPAGKKWHHNFLGGLLQHTLYMSQIADSIAGIYPRCDRDILLCGVMLHDIGKVYELGLKGNIDYTTRGRLEGHISIGYHAVSSAIENIEGFPDGLAAEIKHLILSHQGEAQYGSPVVPMTLEAVILHYIDQIDSQVDAYSQIIDRQAGNNLEWSDYIRLKDR